MTHPFGTGRPGTGGDFEPERTLSEPSLPQPSAPQSPSKQAPSAFQGADGLIGSRHHRYKRSFYVEQGGTYDTWPASVEATVEATAPYNYDLSVLVLLFVFAPHKAIRCLQ